MGEQYHVCIRTASAKERNERAQAYKKFVQRVISDMDAKVFQRLSIIARRARTMRMNRSGYGLVYGVLTLPVGPVYTHRLVPEALMMAAKLGIMYPHKLPVGTTKSTLSVLAISGE